MYVCTYACNVCIHISKYVRMYVCFFVCNVCKTNQELSFLSGIGFDVKRKTTSHMTVKKTPIHRLRIEFAMGKAR